MHLFPVSHGRGMPLIIGIHPVNDTEVSRESHLFTVTYSWIRKATGSVESW